MPLCSNNRGVSQLFKGNMPPMLKPVTHNQMLMPHQSLMRPFVLILGMRDETGEKMEIKNKNIASDASNSGFLISHLCTLS